MAQLFIGVKPGVGPVVKVLKHNEDDPLTLANEAYERYYFNSETQNLSYVGNAKVWDVDPSVPTGTYFVDGDEQTYKYRVSYFNSQTSNTVSASGNLQNIFPDGFLGIPEVRVKMANGRYLGGRRDLDLIYWNMGANDAEAGVIYSYQFPAAMGRVSSFSLPDGSHNRARMWNNGQYDPATQSSMGYKIGDWYTRFGIGYSNSNGLNQPTGAAGSTLGGHNSANIRTTQQITMFWDLPANASPMPAYTSVPGLESVRLSPAEVIMARPGYSVDSSVGSTQRIFDSTINPSMCILHGETGNIAKNSYIDIAGPLGFTLSETTIVDMMVRRVGAPQYIPAFVESGYTKERVLDFSYQIYPDFIRIYNDSNYPIIVRYLVFDADMDPPSTGGSQVIFSGNDGIQNYHQIKRPGTTDPASKVNDIILDTRFPMLQIVKEGYIPLSQFSSSGVESAQAYGNRQHTVQFENTGFMPYVKYTVVFPHTIMNPVMAQRYTYNSSAGPNWGPPSNQSALCRLTDNSAKFWLSPGNWGYIHYVSPYNTYSLPDPLGIRYYIFGIAPTD